MQQWFWNTVLKEITLTEPLKKSLAALYRKKITYKVHVYGLKADIHDWREKGGEVFLH